MKMLLVIVTTVLLLAACGGDDVGEEPDRTVPSGTDGGVILEISDEGGFVPVEFNLTRVPRFTVFNDGTVVMPSREQFGFPGPALIPLVEEALDDETISDLLAFVDDLGLAELDAVDLTDAPNVADASTTVLRYFDGGGEHKISIYALGFGGSGDARTAIVESMIQRLEEATNTGERNPYEAERLVVFSQAAEGLDPVQVNRAGPWPFSFDPTDATDQTAGFSCLTVEGADASAVSDMLEGADSMTTWELEGTDYRVFGRPLLPHQEGC